MDIDQQRPPAATVPPDSSPSPTPEKRKLPPTIDVLLVEDNPSDAWLVMRALNAQHGTEFRVNHTDRLGMALDYMAHSHYDVVLLDLTLPDSTGLDTLRRLCEGRPSMPVVVLSGHDDENLAIEAVHLGAQDYLTKDRIDGNLLARSLNYAIERKGLQEQVREQAEIAEAERARLAKVLDSLPVGVYLAEGEPNDRTMRWVFVNRFGQEQTSAPTLTPGVVSEEFTAYWPDGRIYEEDELPIQKTIWTGEPVADQEIEFHYHRGGQRTFLASTSLLRSRGNTNEVVAVLNDVSARKEAEEALRVSEERFRLALEHSPITIFTQDTELRYTWSYNPARGFSAAELGKTDFDLFSPEEAEEVMKIKRSVLETGVGRRAEVRLTAHLTGQPTYFDMRVEPLREDGRITGITCVAVDITNRKRLEQQVLRHAEMLRAEHERLASVIASLDIAIALHDKDARFTLANDTWLTMSRYRLEELLGRTYADFPDEPLAPTQHAMVTQVLSTGEPIELRDFYTKTRAHPEGGYYDRSIVPVRGPDGEITGALSAIVDVTDKARARKEVEAQRGLLETLLEAAPVGIVLYDREMRVVRCNAAWGRLMGLDCDTAVGHVIYDIAPGIDNYKEGHRTALAGKSIDLRGVPYRRLGAEQDRYFDVSYRAIRDADGQVSGILAVVIDVTERHELDERKNEFIALTSHELKTPITAIKGYSQMALRTTGQLGDERLARTLRIIDEQTNRLIRLINELLDMSRMQGGMLTLNRQTLDLRHLALETVDAQELTAPDFAFDVDLPPEPVIVSADRQRIEQVLVNLLQNAVKYSQSSPRVDVKMRVEGAEVVTSVRDYGVGIPAIDQEHIFERFFRASNVRERGSGLGLGLAISYGIVARHGGRMWLESHEGKGSTFYFALPLASAPSSG